MGTIAVATAMSPGPRPSHSSFEKALWDSLNSSDRPYPPVHELILDSYWRHLIIVFSEGQYTGEPGRDDLLFDGNEGIWAVRGRRPVFPRPAHVPPPLSERSYEEKGGSKTLYYNDASDVDVIARWLNNGPTRGFIDYFKKRQVERVNKMESEGRSNDYIDYYSGGEIDGTPYLEARNSLERFYEQSRDENLWVECYIGQ